MATRNLTVVLAGDASGATKALEESTSGFAKFGKAAAIAGVAGVAAIGALAVKGVAKLRRSWNPATLRSPDTCSPTFPTRDSASSATTSSPSRTK